MLYYHQMLTLHVYICSMLIVIYCIFISSVYATFISNVICEYWVVPKNFTLHFTKNRFWPFLLSKTDLEEFLYLKINFNLFLYSIFRFLHQYFSGSRQKTSLLQESSYEFIWRIGEDFESLPRNWWYFLKPKKFFGFKNV